VLSIHRIKNEKSVKEKTEMARKTNLEKLKQVFEESKRGSAGVGNVNWWRPQWGDNLIRVLPPVDEDDVFFHETARHRINGEWFYCLKHKKDPETGRGMSCPACNARSRLYRSGDAALQKIAKEIKAKKQFLMNIIDRNADDPTQVYVYAAGIKLWNKMTSLMVDDDIDITDVEEGYDFLIKKEEGPKTDQGTFPTYDNSKPKMKPSPLHEDEEVAETILKNRYKLEEIPVFEDPERIQDAVDRYLQEVSQSPANEEFYDEEENSSNSQKEESSSKKQTSSSDKKSSSSPKSDISDFKAKLKAQLESDDDDED
jgi:hypothetical protein